ncbi:LOW QUALITY PROTEIN: UDP-glucuronosyltransferase 1A6-like [Pterocles gutturalis]
MALRLQCFYQCTWMFLLLPSSSIFAEGGRMLVIPQDGSHWLSMRPVVGKLQQNGHEVVVLVPSTNLYLKPKEPQNYTVKVYPTPYQVGLKSFVNAHFTEQSVLNIIITMYQNMLEIFRFFVTNCRSLLHNEDMMQYLRESKFDVVFTDPIIMCGPIIAEYLSQNHRMLEIGRDLERSSSPIPLPEQEHLLSTSCEDFLVVWILKLLSVQTLLPMSPDSS